MNSRLSSLELHGYKTFANITNFAFPSMVTAIVGPNGSGKSNIADSIRWVLGEQSFSLLRAKKTEDMIFAGSENKPRSGMASVSIAFNNHDNWLPIEYSEVVLTRRAYRDGQNEYLINNQRVRLKDFYELLGKTGLADRTYTIIGQGLVDVALSIKPDERRKLFEEAAGIGLYRTRKEEAIKRLETTRRNLDRILDILEEIKPRLRSLERQAAKANEYLRLQSELNNLLREWYGYYWFKGQEELKIAQSQCKERNDQLQENRDKLRFVRSELQKSSDLLQSQRNQLSLIHTQSSKLFKELENFEKEYAVLEERLHSNSQQKHQLDLDIDELNERIISKEKELIEVERENEQIKSDFDHAQNELNTFKDQFNKKVLVRKEVESQISEIRKNLLLLETNIIRHQAQINESQERKQELDKQIPLNESSIKEIVRELTDLRNEIHNQEERLSKLADQINLVQSNLSSAKKDLTSIRDQELNSNKKRNLLEAELTRMSVKLDMLKQAEQDLSNYSDGAKALISSVHKKELSYDLSALTPYLFVPQKFEIAITAALGEILDLVIIKNKTISKDTLAEIHQKIDERVALLSVIGQQKSHTETLTIKHSKLIGIASDLVEIKGEYKNTLNKLLNTVVIMEDKESALDVLDHIPDTHRIVTLNGEVFLKNGVVILGKVTSSQKISTLREINDLEQIIEDNSKNLKNHMSLLSSLDSRANETSNKISDIEKQLIELNKEYFDLSHSKELIQIEISKKENQQNWLENQLSDSKAKIIQLDSSISQLESEITSNKEIHGKNKVDEEKLLKNLESLSILEVQNQLHAFETNTLLASQRNNNSLEKIKRLSGEIHENKQRYSDLVNRRNLLIGSINNLEKEVDALKQKESETKQNLREIQTDLLGPQEKSMQTTENLYAQQMSTEKELQKENLLKENLYTQAELDLTRKKENLENLKSRIEDDFGLIELEYHNFASKTPPLTFPDMVIQSLPQKLAIPEGLHDTIRESKNQIRRIGSINPEAAKEYTEVKERYEFLKNQVSDLESASEDLKKVITELDEIMRIEFLSTYRAVSTEFTKMFTTLFNGGSARLTISDQTDPIASGIDIEARLPGRREQGLVLLSGGERSLTAIALVFALQKVSPTPFCVLDEVDAMLDESNVGRFVDLLKELSEETQFVLITHNRNTVQAADVIYGVTKGRDTTSQVISLKLDEVDDTYIE